MLEVRDLLDLDHVVIYKNKFYTIKEITSSYIMLSNGVIVLIDDLWVNEADQLEAL